MTSKRIFICADHGLAIVYFLQTDVVSTLLDAGLEVVLLTDDNLLDKIRRDFGRPGLIVEGLRLDQARRYSSRSAILNNGGWISSSAGASQRMNLETVNNYVNWVQSEASASAQGNFPADQGRVGFDAPFPPGAPDPVVAAAPFHTSIYTDLFERYQPDLVVASTAGWRMDRYLLREAKAHHVKTLQL